jgi:hypothetical protein
MGPYGSLPCLQQQDKYYTYYWLVIAVCSFAVATYVGLSRALEITTVEKEDE